MGLFGKVISSIFGSNSNKRTREDIDFENQVRSDGVEYAGKRIAEELNKKISSKDLARQFVLEELDAARKGNSFAQNFVKNSGFKSYEYIGAMNKTEWEGDESELEHLQLFLRIYTNKISDIDLMVELSTIVVDEIMKEWGLGKHENNKFNMSNKNIELEEILKQFNYSEENIENIIREYSDTVESLITGQSSLGEIKRRNQFAEHMAIAALKGNYKGIAYSCFVNHGGIFENLLPISIVDFSDKAFEFLLVLLNKYIKFKFSESFERYLKNNKNEVLDLANHDNKYAQFLVGFWYVFDKNEINSLENRMKWYEKSALNGYSLAMFNIANFYDNANENLPTNLKKAAYWYRATALQKNNIFTYDLSIKAAYNLSVMYLQGDGVSYNKNQAKLWLSYAYTLAEADDDFEKQIKFYAKKSNIELDYNPNMMNDIEVNPRTAELSNLYTDKISVVNYDKKKLIYVVEKKSQHAEGVFAKIYEDLGAFITQNLMNSEDYEDKLMVMAYGYARRTTAAGLFLQGVFSKKDYIHSEDVFRGLQLQTGHTMKFQEDAFAQALNYIQSYDSRLTRELITKIVLTARNEETVCIHDVGGYMSFEEVLKVFIKTNENEEIPF